MKHGMHNSREYRSWQSMKRRCYDKRDQAYRKYGGRGITVCDSWLNSFEEFYKDMGKRPIQHTLDRIDNNGNYCKENCKWSTEKEQHRNQRTNIVIEYNGEKMILADWAEKLKINYNTLYNRLFTYKWSIEKAFTQCIK